MNVTRHLAFAILVLSILFAPMWGMAASISAEADPLATLRPGHPRLLASAQDFDRLSKPLDDPLQAAAVRRLLASAEATLKIPVIVYQAGGRQALLLQARTALQRITLCAAAYQVSHDKRFAERARQEMLAVAAFPNWSPDHFLDVGELAMGMAIGYDWLYEVLSPADRATIKGAIMEKALSFAPVLYNPPPSGKGELKDSRLWWAFDSYNWSQVCHSGLLAAALAVADEEPQTARLVVRGVRTLLAVPMKSYAPDGAWPEGPGYWGYGTTYNVLALAMLESALGSDLGLGDAEPAFHQTAVFRMQMDSPAGMIFNFADVGLNWEKRVSPAFGWLARRYGPPQAVMYFREKITQQFQSYSDDGEKDRFYPFLLFWLPPNAPVGEPPARDVRFRGLADVAVFRGSWNDRDAVFLGLKAGTNGVNHAHLDLGAFVLDSDGQRWASFLGPDNYDLPDYFGAKRWNYFRLINYSQSTLTPGARKQDAKATAPIVGFFSGESKAGAVTDLTTAYPGAAQRILRGVFLLERTRALIQDDITAGAAELLWRWQMMTSAKIELSQDKRTATLSQNGKTLRVELLSPESATFAVESARPPTAQENQNEGYSLLVGTVPALKKSGDVRLAVLLTPVGPKWKAQSAMPPLEPLAGLVNP